MSGAKCTIELCAASSTAIVNSDPHAIQLQKPAPHHGNCPAIIGMAAFGMGDLAIGSIPRSAVRNRYRTLSAGIEPLIGGAFRVAHAPYEP
jgi:hypothetical protein